jgi:hypothetical protein
MARDQPAQRVGAAAGRVGHHDLDRPVGPRILRTGRRRKGAGCKARAQKAREEMAMNRHRRVSFLEVPMVAAARAALTSGSSE